MFKTPPQRKRTPAGALFEESISSLLFVVHDFFMKWLTVFIGSVHDEGRGHAIFRQHCRDLRGTPVEVTGLFVFMDFYLFYRQHYDTTHMSDCIPSYNLYKLDLSL